MSDSTRLLLAIGMLVSGIIAAIAMFAIWYDDHQTAERQVFHERCVADGFEARETWTPRGVVVSCVPHGYQGSVNVDMGDQTTVVPVVMPVSSGR